MKLMRGKLLLIGVIVLLFAGSYTLRAVLNGPTPQAESLAGGEDAARRRDPLPWRIVSTVPSVTETLFALGLGDRVVGVSSFCRYPAEVERLPKIGGTLDQNYEAIELLQPDLIVLLQGASDNEQKLRRLGFKTLAVEHRTIEGILESLTTIGQACGAEEQAQRVAARIHSRMDAMKRERAERRGPRPGVLLVVGRTRGGGRLADVVIAGKEGHLTRCLELAGGENVYQGDLPFPSMSVEGLLALRPDLIIEFIPEAQAALASPAMLTADWRALDSTPAVRDGRIHAITEDRLSVPGPDFIVLAERFAELIQREPTQR